MMGWFAAVAQVPGQRLTALVDPFLGTGGHGHTYPGATVPFGMVQLSPDNGRKGWDWCSGYHYSDSTIAGFSHTHLSGTGCADMGDISFMPSTTSNVQDSSHRSPFSHAQEFAEPGYYRVKLLDCDILVELTATERAGFHRYTYPRSDSEFVLIDLRRGQDDHPTDTRLVVADPKLVTGYRRSTGWAEDQQVFFAVRFSRSIVRWRVGDGNSLGSMDKELRGTGVRALLEFARSSSHEPLLAKVGISSVSVEGALRNLDAEIPGWDLNSVRLMASQKWEHELKKVKIVSQDHSTEVTFYTALYHAFLAPTLLSDVDGRYRGGNHDIDSSIGCPYYSTYSLWDTYRAAHPLYTLVQKERVDGFVQCMLAFARETGHLPIWQLAANETNTMVGYHAVPVIADAYLKGFRGFNAQQALQTMETEALRDFRGLRYYTAELSHEVLEGLAKEERTYGLLIQLQPTSRYVAGFGRRLSGDTLRYHSSDPSVSLGLIVKASDGKQEIDWESAVVPADTGNTNVTFVWLAGMVAGRGEHRFTLFCNDDSLATFMTRKEHEPQPFSIKGNANAQFSFDAATKDSHGDFFGTMTLTVPSSFCRSGLPVKFRMIADGDRSTDWCMVFEHQMRDTMRATNEFGLRKDSGKSNNRQVIRADIEWLHPAAPSIIKTVGAGDFYPRTVIFPGHNTVYIPIRPVETATRVTVSDGVLGNRGSALSTSLEILPVHPYTYIPSDREGESVSKTLEYAIDDFAIAAMAHAMGNDLLAKEFHLRSEYFRSLFDSTVGFLRGRRADGSWVAPFDPRLSTEKQPEYTEGNAWQYLWLVPQDIPGLVSLLGGAEHFDAKLDSLFNQSSNIEGTGAPPDVSGLIGMYAHGNEPSHHIAYLYDYVGKPWKTQAMIRRIMTEFYHTGPEGLCGNEDCGQMSAWYVFSAMGFYPVTPVGGVYAIGSPLVEKATLTVGETPFTMIAQGLTPANLYIQSATLNGIPLRRPWITHNDIRRGGSLVFKMGPKPNVAWGSSERDAPPSLPPK